MNGENGRSSIEEIVTERYSRGAQEREPALCCPVEYDPSFLRQLPEEILERDYGCGDPSRYVRKGDVVLDLGSGGGKICYIAAQIVGPTGRVIGVDMNDEMLALARKYRPELEQKFGVPIRFHKAKIQDLALDLDNVAGYLGHDPISGVDGLGRFEEFVRDCRENRPMIGDSSVDVVVSNCVLNLVREADRKQMFREIFRVLKKGGRAAISDIVSDEEVPPHLKENHELWSGCISGAFTETGLLKAFQEAGFYGITVAKRDETPWQTIEGIQFRSMTVVAYKGKEGKCLERNQAVIYKGPWRTVTDDDGHTLYLGERMAVCDKTYRIYTNGEGPYHADVIGIEPIEVISIEEAEPFNCRQNARRDPRETKGMEYNNTEGPDHSLCGPDGCC